MPEYPVRCYEAYELQKVVFSGGADRVVYLAHAIVTPHCVCK